MAYGPYKTAPIEFTISNRQGTTATLKMIQKDIKREVLFNDTMTLSFTTSNHKDNAQGYALIENENMIIHDGHVYKIKQISDYGSYKKLVCIHEFSDLAKVQKYDYLDGNKTAVEVLDFLFSDTEWAYQLADEGIREFPLFIRPEKFGASSVLKLLKEFHKISGIEFQILPNKVLQFAFKVNDDAGYADYNYGENIKSLSTDSDSTDFYTRIRGFYSTVTGQDESGNDILEWNYVDVINEDAEAEYGVLEMDSLWNSDIKNKQNMEFLCWTKLYTNFNTAIDLESADFEPKFIGQSVRIIHPYVDVSKMSFNIRVLKITEGLIHNELKPVSVEIGNYFWEYFEQQADDRIDTLEKEVRKLKMRTSNIFLSKLMLGNKNLFAVPGLILASNATLPNDITAIIDYEKLEEFTGLFIVKKTAYESYYVTIKTYNKDNVLTGTFDYDTQKDIIEQWKTPIEDIFAVTIEVMSKSPEIFEEGVDRKQIYAFKFNESEVDPEPTEGIWLSEFTLGNLNLLDIYGIVSSDANYNSIKAFIEYSKFDEYLGLKATLKDEYKGFYLNELFYEDDDNLSIYEMTDGVIVGDSYPYVNQLAGGVVITEVPYEEFDPTIHKHQFLTFKYTKKRSDNEVKTEGVFYAYVGSSYISKNRVNCFTLRIINNITNFREDFMDESFYFESDFETTEYYPSADNMYLYGNELVQVVDGLITSVIIRPAG